VNREIGDRIGEGADSASMIAVEKAMPGSWRSIFAVLHVILQDARFHRAL
jgi:hypothetical protein